MDDQGFKKWLVPLVVQVLTAAGKYVAAPLAALTGVTQAEAGNWWTGLAGILSGIVVGALCHWLTSRHILAKASDATDAKLAGDGSSPVVTLPPRE